MSLEITGRLLKKYDTVTVSDKLKKREFVLEMTEEINGNKWINYAAMQLINNKCEIIDPFSVGDTVKVSFNIKGNKWIKDGKERFFSNLDAWRVELATQGSGSQPASTGNGDKNYRSSSDGYSASPNMSSGNDSKDDDLPF